MKEKIVIFEPSLFGHGGNFVKLLARSFSQENLTIAIYPNHFNSLFIQTSLNSFEASNIYYLPLFLKKLKIPTSVEKFILVLVLTARLRPKILLLPSIDGMVYLSVFFRPLIWLLSPQTRIFGFLASYKNYYSSLSLPKKILFDVGLFCFDRVLVNDEFYFAHLQARKYKNVCYMPDPVEEVFSAEDSHLLRRKWGFKETALIVGMVGTIDYRKGADLIIKAALEIERKDIIFVLAGSVAPEIYEALRCRSNENRVSDNLVIIDRFLEIQELYEILLCLDLVLLPYRNYHFGIASILLRAIACSKPSLVSRFGWMERMANSNSEIFSFETYGDMLVCLQSLDKSALATLDFSVLKSRYIMTSIEQFLSSWNWK